MSRREPESGTTAVEAALVLPLALALTGLILVAGIGLACSALVARGAEVAARAVALPKAPYADAVGDRYRSEAEVVREAEDATLLLTLDPGAVVVTPAAPREGQPFSVAVTYRWSNPAAALLRLVPGVEAAAAETITFTATAQGVRE